MKRLISPNGFRTARALHLVHSASVSGGALSAARKPNLLELVPRLHTAMAVRRDTGGVGRDRNRAKAARKSAHLTAPLQVLRGWDSVENFLPNHYLPEARVQIDTDVRDDDSDLDVASTADRFRWNAPATETALDRLEPQQPPVGGRILLRVFETSRMRNRTKRYGVTTAVAGWRWRIRSVKK